MCEEIYHLSPCQVELLTAGGPDLAHVVADRRDAAPLLLLVPRPHGPVQPVPQRLHLLVAAAPTAKVRHGGVQRALRGQQVGVLRQLGGEAVLGVDSIHFRDVPKPNHV